MSENDDTEEVDPEVLEVIQAMISPDNSPVWSPDTMTYFGPKSRAILVSGDIEEPLANGICSQLYSLAEEDPDGIITVHINTPGGSVVDALAIYDTMRIIPCPIVTLVSGSCYSGGIIVALAGDMRVTTPNSMYFYHQPIMSSMSIDSEAVMDSNQSFYNWCRSKLRGIMLEHTKMSVNTWNYEFGNSTSKYFDAAHAIKYKVATHMLDYSIKPKIEEIEEL